jgi:hypothetical protein
VKRAKGQDQRGIASLEQATERTAPAAQSRHERYVRNCAAAAARSLWSFIDEIRKNLTPIPAILSVTPTWAIIGKAGGLASAVNAHSFVDEARVFPIAI